MIKDGQDTEEEWFSNSGLSTGLEKLLNIIGKPIQLKDYKGYAAGLDTKSRMMTLSMYNAIKFNVNSFNFQRVNQVKYHTFLHGKITKLCFT